MRDYVISTDSTADLPTEYISKHSIIVHPLCYILGSIEYGQKNSISPELFYSKMRQGMMPTTGASNPDFISNTFTAHIKNGYDILHISFSSGLSSSYHNASLCAAQAMAKYPEAKIQIVDSLSASMGQGLLVYYAVKMKESGCSLEETTAWLEENKLHICHQFTVDDLHHLHRGGRVSKAAAVIGTLINVKPILHVDNTGCLIPLSNVRGRKKSLESLVNNMESTIGTFKNEIIFISHGDCQKDAEAVARLVKERFSIPSVWINYISPTIGAHSGPGTVALFYLGQER